MEISTTLFSPLGYRYDPIKTWRFELISHELRNSNSYLFSRVGGKKPRTFAKDMIALSYVDLIRRVKAFGWKMLLLERI